MTHGILTNQFHAVYNYEAIDRDFVIFKVTKESSKLDRTNVLDIPLADWKALSVQYSYGRNAFVLFRKGSVDENKFRLQIQQQYTEVKVSRIDVTDAESRKWFYYNERLLAQLLLNSLRMPKNEKLCYQNLTGSLFYTDPSWICKDKQTKRPYMLYALKVVLLPNMYLCLEVKTFRLKTGDRYSGEKEYIFDTKTKQLRKKLKDDEKNTGIVFVEGAFKNKHNTVGFLALKSIHSFRKCKLGVLDRLLTDVKEKLGEYLTLTPHYQENVQSFEIPEMQKKVLDEKSLALFMTRPIHIIDDAKTERSAIMRKEIERQLKKYYGLTVKGDSWDKDAYHIRLIHEEDHYIERKLPDPHSQIPDNMIVQHITEEQELMSEKDKASPALNKVLQEILIKEDVIAKTVRLYDWKSSKFEKIWTFVMRKNISDERKVVFNRAGDKVYYNYRYTAVSIDCEGNMCFEQFCDDSEKLTDKQINVIYSFEIIQKEEKKIENRVEGLVYTDIDNIHAIIHTPMSTMPAVEAIRNRLELTDPRTTLDRDKLLDALEVFRKENTEDREQVYTDMLREKLLNFEGTIKKGAFRKLMNYRHNRNAAKELNRFLEREYGILIMPEFKNSDMEDLYWFENVLDIKYYTETNYIGENEFRYFVGTKPDMLKFSLHNACVVRKVISRGETIDFQPLLSLMAVDFVRSNQHTVLPFPFKYLREYSAMNKQSDGTGVQ